MIQTVVLTHTEAPPSLNEYAHKHWRVFHRTKHYWQDIFEAELMSSPLSRPAPPRRVVRATAVITFPTRHRRDEGNYRSLIEKALGDALVNGGWLDDDTRAQFTFGDCVVDGPPGPKRTVISLMVDDAGLSDGG